MRSVPLPVSQGRNKPETSRNHAAPLAQHICHSGFAHVVEQLKRQLPLPTLSTGADGGIVADDIRLNLGFVHAVKESQRQLPSGTLLARANGGTVADDIRTNLGLAHPVEELQRQLPMPTFLTSADGGIVALVVK